MITKAIDAARNQRSAAQTIHRPLHDRRVGNGIFALRPSRYATHVSIVAREFDFDARGWERGTKFELALSQVNLKLAYSPEPLGDAG